MTPSSFLLIVILTTFVSVFAQLREKRKTGDQPPAEKCNYFNWGGTSRIHFYICCNNCHSADRTCDGTTYHSASRQTYCDRCGVDNSKGNGKRQETFSCGGCSGQNYMLNKCKRWYNSIPGTCWIFTRCFRKKCKKQYRQKRRRSVLNMPDTCFNKICDAGENINNCPEDCCQTVSDQCTWKENKCIPKCCGESTCCESSIGNTRRKQTSSGGNTWIKQTTAIMYCVFLTQVYITILFVE